MTTRHWMQSSRFDDSQDVSSSKDSQDDGSQMLDTRKIEEMLEKHKATVKTRRRDVESRLRRAQDEGWATLRQRREAEEVAYQGNLKTAQRPHLEDLRDLVEERKHLHREIDKTRDELERAQIAVSQQLGACLKSRMDLLRK